MAQSTEGKTRSADARAQPSSEVWLGGEAFRHIWSLYSGADIAPFGAIREDGWRLRIVGGYGQYDHLCRSIDPVTFAPALAPCRGDASFFDLLAGYRWQAGRWTLKALAGATAKSAVATSHDGAATKKEWEFGAKAVLESWLDVSPHVWLAFDASYSTLSTNPALRTRIGYRVTPSLSLGVEASASALMQEAVAPYGDKHVYGVRAGPMARYEWATGEASLTAGVASSVERTDKAMAKEATETSLTPFASLNILLRY